MLKKNNFSWNHNSTEAFDKLKEIMSIGPLLSLPNFSVEFVIETDACDEGVGAVLMQNGKPIAYMSKALSKRHKSMSVYEKEMLALVLAIQKWRTYLLGKHFKVLTDHHSLKFLFQRKITTPSPQRWLSNFSWV